MSTKTLKSAPKTKVEAPAPTSVIFKSVNVETHEIEIMGIRSVRGNDEKLTFTVPAADADRFAKHHHVVTGRVVRRG